MVEAQQFCTFFVGGLCFGIDVQSVQEIVRFQEMTPVPLAPRTVRGLMNLRGQIVPAVDLRRRLRLPEGDPEDLPMNVVVCTDDEVVSFLVDEIGDVIEVGEHGFEDPPDTLSAEMRELITGVYKLPGQLMLVLDAGRVSDISGD